MAAALQTAGELQDREDSAGPHATSVGMHAKRLRGRGHEALRGGVGVLGPALSGGRGVGLFRRSRV